MSRGKKSLLNLNQIPIGFGFERIMSAYNNLTRFKKAEIMNKEGNVRSGRT